MSVTLDDIQAARQRIASGIYHSPCPRSIPLSEISGCEAFCKLDYLQRTGSFKERGARNALLLLSAAERARGVISASAGNHALGLAYHGHLLGTNVTVVMPKYAPLIKIATCRRLGARVILEGETLADARQKSRALAASEGLTYVHGFDDAAVIAGQGTIGLEVLEQVPDVEAIIVPVGGGGLIAGVAVAVKALKPEVLILGVEPENAAGFTAAMKAGHSTDISLRPTLADGLAVGRVGELAFALAAPLIDRLVTVNEASLALAVLRLAELEKSVVEGAGAAPLAACLANKVPEIAGRRTVLLLTGGNIDLKVLSRVIEKGLVADGRLCRFTAVISDRPGGLARLAQIIAQAGASIQDIAHERAFSGPDVTAAHVSCTVETVDRDHELRLYQALRESGIEILPLTPPPTTPGKGA